MDDDLCVASPAAQPPPPPPPHSPFGILSQQVDRQTDRDIQDHSIE